MDLAPFAATVSCMDTPTQYIQFERVHIHGVVTAPYDPFGSEYPWSHMNTLLNRLLIRGPLTEAQVRMVLGSLGRESIDVALDTAKRWGLIVEEDGLYHPCYLDLVYEPSEDHYYGIRPQGVSDQQRDL